MPCPTAEKAELIKKCSHKWEFKITTIKVTKYTEIHRWKCRLDGFGQNSIVREARKVVRALNDMYFWVQANGKEAYENTVLLEK
jgi:hypothetical protein